MSELQLWLQNHNRKMTQDAIDEALMEYITHIEKQRDGLMAALALINPSLDYSGWENGYGEAIGKEINAAIASVKEK